MHDVITSDRPVVGVVARGPGGQFAVPVRVPVTRDGQVVYVLTAVVKPESLLSVLQRQRTDRQWVIGAFDRRKMIAARTRRVRGVSGASDVAEFLAVLGGSALEGWAMTHTLEGGRVYTAYARSSHGLGSWDRHTRRSRRRTTAPLVVGRRRYWCGALRALRGSRPSGRAPDHAINGRAGRRGAPLR